MAVRQTGLGKGFDVLIPKNFDNTLLVDEQERVQKLFIKDIQANPDQPRKHFDQQALNELAASIKKHGILQPLIVTPDKAGNYRIIAGERRWRAAQIADLKQVPAIVRGSKELEQLEIALVENVQRVDLSPLEQAVSIQRLHDQFSKSYQEIADQLGKAATTVNNIVRLLQLPPSAQQALQSHEISEGHARAILAVKDSARQQELLELIKKHGWSVRQAEQYVQVHKSGQPDKKTTAAKLATTTPETKKLSAALKVPVTLRRTAKGGKLEIAFRTDTELSQLIQQLIKHLK